MQKKRDGIKRETVVIDRGQHPVSHQMASPEMFALADTNKESPFIFSLK